MKRVAIACVVLFAFLGLTWLWPSAPAMERGLAALGPVMKAHFIDVGQANATLLEFPGAPGRGRADRCRGAG